MAVVRNVQTNDLYLYLGDNKFRNMRTSKEGVIPSEVARNGFKINLEATVLWNTNPLLENLIKSLNLKFEANERS